MGRTSLTVEGVGGGVGMAAWAPVRFLRCWRQSGSGTRTICQGEGGGASARGFAEGEAARRRKM
jgi:hypothetical protein